MARTHTVDSIDRLDGGRWRLLLTNGQVWPEQWLNEGWVRTSVDGVHPGSHVQLGGAGGTVTSVKIDGELYWENRQALL